MMRKHYHTYLITMLLLAIFLSSCISRTDNSCYDEKPVEGELHLKVTIEEPDTLIPVTIYEGKYENGTPIIYDTLSYSSEIYYLPVNTYYTAVAEYQKDGKTVLSIQGGKISVSDDSSDDYGECWTLTNIWLNLKRK